MKHQWYALIPLTMALIGCGGNDDGTGDEPQILERASRSSAIAVSGDDALIAMVNTDSDSLSVFAADDLRRIAEVRTGEEPSSVVISPDGKTAYVANRADATVVAVTAIDSATPSVSAPVEVGSEPTGLALSPTGARLFVAEFAEGRVSVIDTATMTVTQTIDGPEHPRAVAITNDGDNEDGDELLIVPEFFGEAVAEVSDTGRTGRVRIYQLSDLSATESIAFAPIDSGFEPVTGAGTVMTSPNQLYAVAIHNNKIYVPSVSASPEPPVRFNGNVFPVLYVGNLATRREDRSDAGTSNLARLVFDELGPDDTRFALADLVDIDFFGDTGIAYALSRGSNVVQRLSYIDGPVQIGSAINTQIDIGQAPDGFSAGCVVPIGLATAHQAPRAYVNCGVSRQLGVVDLTTQALTATVSATDPPESAEDIAVNQGQKFFFTGRARWSSEAWSACSSCHPDGLTDNITWQFDAGPRQSTSLDGSFSKGPGVQKQRIFNWTGIFDELHDFERNTRGVSGGLGAVTTGNCGTLAEETPINPLPGNLAQPIKELQDRDDSCTRDWDDVEAWVRTVRPPQRLRSLDAASVARGAVLFGPSSAQQNTGECLKCHGGAGFTASRRFFLPAAEGNAELADLNFTRPATWPAAWNLHTRQIAPQPAASDIGDKDIGPAQVACVLRNVGTFGIPGDTDATDRLEIKPDGARAQGAGGINIPSLYGMSLGAPYLHHGQAKTLQELFADPAWRDHLQAGNPVFVPSQSDITDLANFILSIDADTPEFDIPAAFEGCPPGIQ